MIENGNPELDLRACVRALPRNPGAEIVRYGWRRKDVLSLGQGEGDQPTPRFIIEAAEKALAAGKTFYGPVLGHPETRQEISDYYRRIYELDVPAGRIFVTGSGTTAMHLALTALLDAGDEVIAVTPIWKNLLGAVALAQAHVTEWPLAESSGRWHLDPDGLRRACTPRTKAILVTSPANPSGTVLSMAEMQAVLAIARETRLWVIADEVYGRLTYDRLRAPSFLDIAAPDDRLFTVNSFSKAWAMTGWRLGWLTGPAAAEAPIRDIALYDNLGPPSFTQFAAVAALRDGEDFIAAQKQAWLANRDYTYERLAAMGIAAGAPPEAGFYAFFRVPGAPDTLALARRLIDEAGLSLAPGCAFGTAGEGFMRLCFAVSRPRLAAALDRLESFMKANKF